MGVKSPPNEIVSDSDPSIQVNLANSVISKSPKFINLGLLTFDATGKDNIAFAPSTRAKSLNGMQRDNFKVYWLGYTHDFERVSKTTEYSNHIKNSELETKEVFDLESDEDVFDDESGYDGSGSRFTSGSCLSPFLNYMLIVLVDCHVMESLNLVVVSVEYFPFPAQKIL